LSGKELRGVIQFVTSTERHHQLIQMYSDDVMRIQRQKLVQRISEIVEDLLVVDRSGRSIMSVTDVNVAQEEEL
jgi:hypothetical protein